MFYSFYLDAKVELEYCCGGRNERFGVIDFTISCSVTKGFREAAKAVPASEWKPITKEVTSGGIKVRKETGQEYATVPYVPQWAGNQCQQVKAMKKRSINDS